MINARTRMVKRMEKLSKTRITSEGHQIIPLSRTPGFSATFDPLGIIQISLEKAVYPFRTRRCQSLTHHLLFYVIEGEYAAWSPSGFRPLPAGSIYSVRSDAVRQITLLSDYGTNIFFYLRPGKLWDDRFREPHRLQPCTYIRHLQRAVTGYLESVNSADIDSNRLTAAYANLIKELILRECQQSMSPAEVINRQKISFLQQQISACPQKAWTVREMASLIKVSESHLYALCRAFTGKSPLELVIEHRIRKACLLLQSLTLDEPLKSRAIL
ncbi:MAG: hypothetical protein D6820_11765, partial [Lentisphaerae bacterium]